MKNKSLSLTQMAADILSRPDPWEKAERTLRFSQDWKRNCSIVIGITEIPETPARPDKPELLPPKDTPRRRKGGTLANKISLLHALAHIELNAIDLAWDLMARFAYLSDENAPEGSFSLPRPFFDDWIQVSEDEARHFLLISNRMKDFDTDYGDLTAHGCLWESAEATKDDFAARLAIVPMVLEARGLDVTPGMIAAMKKQGDMITADALQLIHDEEITHVGAGTHWFDYYCNYHKLDGETTWRDLVQKYFYGHLKKPFNHPSREKGGLLRHWYEPLAD